MVWDAALVFIHFVMKEDQGFSEYFQLDKNQPYLLVELGAGTGAAGLTFIKRFKTSNVILTEICEECRGLIR